MASTIARTFSCLINADIPHPADMMLNPAFALLIASAFTSSGVPISNGLTTPTFPTSAALLSASLTASTGSVFSSSEHAVAPVAIMLFNIGNMLPQMWRTFMVFFSGAYTFLRFGSANSSNISGGIISHDAVGSDIWILSTPRPSTNSSHIFS